MPAKSKSKPSARNRSTVRIIGGRFRGRRIPVPPDGVRPTPDRVRETVFNWLTPWLTGTRCLDLFAGTGALGLEALSRGAAAAVFVDQDRRAADQLREMLRDLGCQDARVVVADAQRLAYAALGCFDIVFLDPPFGTTDLQVLCKLLESSGALAEGAHIYMEMNRRQTLPEVPATWTIVREQTAGQVRFALAERNPTVIEED
jgi:16S rRNA (guanine966-N2)-methyltransferase